MRTETTSKSLRQLVRDFNEGKIQLPQFQRDYIWKPAKIRNLLDSLLRDFPIGGFYLWRPSGRTLDPKPKKFGGIRIAGEFTGYLIDGQQRLTSLEAAFGLYSGEDKQGQELRCYLDLSATSSSRGRDTRIFVSYGGKKSTARRVETGDSTLIPVSSFLDGSNQDLRRSTEESLKLRSGWTAKRIESAMGQFDSASKMLGQLVPCTTVYEVTDQEAVEVFSRLNKGGTPLRQGDVRAAELARGSAVGVLTKMREFVLRDQPQRLGFGFSFAFRALVVFHRGSAQFTSLKPDWMDAPGPNGRSLAQSWKATEHALNEALDFADKRMGWSRRILLPSTNALVVFAAALDHADFKAGDLEHKLYQRWLCLTALRGVFQGSVETTINRFLRGIRESRRHPARGLVDHLKKDEGRRIRADEFYGYAHPWGATTQVMHAWLVSREAKDWLTGESTDALARADGTMLPGGELTVHHIFARKLLAGKFDDDDANCPANFALLSRSTNSEFGDTPPDAILATLKPEERAAAGVQFFGEGAGDQLAPDRYEEFCEWRAGRLAEALNVYLGLVRLC